MGIELKGAETDMQIACSLGTAHSICLGHAVAIGTVMLNEPSLNHYHREVVFYK